MYSNDIDTGFNVGPNTEKAEKELFTAGISSYGFGHIYREATRYSIGWLDLEDETSSAHYFHLGFKHSSGIYGIDLSSEYGVPVIVGGEPQNWIEWTHEDLNNSYYGGYIYLDYTYSFNNEIGIIVNLLLDPNIGREATKGQYTIKSTKYAITSAPGAPVVTEPIYEVFKMYGDYNSYASASIELPILFQNINSVLTPFVGISLSAAPDKTLISGGVHKINAYDPGIAPHFITSLTWGNDYLNQLSPVIGVSFEGEMKVSNSILLSYGGSTEFGFQSIFDEEEKFTDKYYYDAGEIRSDNVSSTNYYAIYAAQDYMSISVSINPKFYFLQDQVVSFAFSFGVNSTISYDFDYAKSLEYKSPIKTHFTKTYHNIATGTSDIIVSNIMYSSPEQTDRVSIKTKVPGAISMNVNQGEFIEIVFGIAGEYVHTFNIDTIRDSSYVGTTISVDGETGASTVVDHVKNWINDQVENSVETDFTYKANLGVIINLSEENSFDCLFRFDSLDQAFELDIAYTTKY